MLLKIAETIDISSGAAGKLNVRVVPPAVRQIAFHHWPSRPLRGWLAVAKRIICSEQTACVVASDTKSAANRTVELTLAEEHPMRVPRRDPLLRVLDQDRAAGPRGWTWTPPRASAAISHRVSSGADIQGPQEAAILGALDSRTNGCRAGG
jgi:hypothetical protein